MMNILKNFRLNDEKENHETVIAKIENDMVFKGTNLWILVFAIFIASLGLNVNSTAVIIGAMLVSPLMGPIIGLGLGISINDLSLLRRALTNYFFAATVGLVTSTIYFLLSPINDAHSEILARTSPNIYDVLIALFGGFAGILALTSKQKGNVIPGVAIATALMPPLCTAGYGLATLKPEFFFGAFYLFIINTVFIAFATLLTTRILKFPYRHLPDKRSERKSRNIVWLIVIITTIPSLYFGYDIVKQNKFQQIANHFVENEANFPNDYLLKKTIDPKKRDIILTFGGKEIKKEQIDSLKEKLSKYYLDDATLEIRQGFAYLDENDKSSVNNEFTTTLNEKESQLKMLAYRLDSVEADKKLSRQVIEEFVAQYPGSSSVLLQPEWNMVNAPTKKSWLFIITSGNKNAIFDKTKIINWLKIRLNTDSILYSDNTANSSP